MKNSVELIGWYGGDEVNACSAWTSTSRNLTEKKKARIPELLNMLAKEGHHTPFEKSMVHFLVDTDIASHIHILKHRISSLNAESARYKELKDDKFYIPPDWEGIKCSEDVGEKGVFLGREWQDILSEYTNAGNNLYHQCLKDLEPLLGRKRSKESARFFKTYNSQIQADVSFNWRSFVNFQKLRNSEHAQKEIKEISQMMLEEVKKIKFNPFEHTIKAFDL